MGNPPDPTIEQIEAEILKAKFTESPAEQYLSTRARQRMLAADIAKSKDDRVKAAFLAGYRQAKAERGSFLFAFSVSMVAWGIIIVLSMSWL